MHRLSRLLSPQSIAIVGASERPGSLAATTQRQLLDSGYCGLIYAVNPKYEILYDDPCYPGLADLPEAPDLVVYAISGLALESSFNEALEMGVGGILIYAANHLENDDDPPLVERLRRRAAAAGIPVCGGNSMGFYNYDDNVIVSFDTPPAGRPAGHIGLILHSGSGMTYLANNDARFRYNYVIASAQEINASVGDYMDYLLEQVSTRVIAVMLENVRDVDAFVGALEKARCRSIPVVITRLGRTAKSAQMAMSHSGAIVGDQDALVALCRRHGAILCRDLDEMIVTAMLFAAGCRVRGGALASMLDSGGMREQMIDLADDYGIEFAQIGAPTEAVLRQHLEAHLEAVNPMDGMGDLGRNTETTYFECGKALLDDPATGLLSFEFEFRDDFSHYPGMFDVSRRLAAHNDKPLVLINSSSFTSVDATAAALCGEDIPVINGIDVGLRAMRNLMDFTPASSAPAVKADHAIDPGLIARWIERLEGLESLDEYDSLALFDQFGLPVVGRALVTDLDSALAAAADCGYPVVLKTAQAGILHKSDQGGVRVGLDGPAMLEEAYLDLSRRLGARALIMPMVGSGVEVSLGMKNDKQFGPMIIVACGGVMIELLAERAFRLAPVNAAEAGEMLDSIRLGKLLDGLRGQPPADRAALVELIVAFSQLAVQLGDAVAEIDMNPVIVARDGCVIVDALIIPR